MLDIIVLIYLTNSIGQTAIQKGLKPGIWKLYTVLAWFAGESMGLSIGLVLFGIDRMLMCLLTALPFAIGGYHIIRTILEKKPDILNDEINHIGENLYP